MKNILIDAFLAAFVTMVIFACSHVRADTPPYAITPINHGGTGQVTANAALNALLPSQTGNNGKVLSTNGTNTSWSASSGGITALTGDVTASGSGSVPASLVATTNSTLTTLLALSLPGSQVTGDISGNAANINAGSNTSLSSLPSLSLPYSQLTGTPAPGANTSLSNLSSVSINSDLLFSSVGTINIGSISAPANTLNSLSFNVADAFDDNIATISENNNGLGLAATFAEGTFVGSVVATTANNASGNSGGFVFQSGTATGTRGHMQIEDGSEGVSGYCFTSQDTAGTGAWAPCSAAGANTSLSNLSSVSINTNLDFSSGGSVNIGSTGAPGAVASMNTYNVDDNFGDIIASVYENDNGLGLSANFASGAFVGSIVATTANNATGSSGGFSFTPGTASTPAGVGVVTINTLLVLPPQAPSNTPANGVSGALALTSAYVLCVYNGSSWVQTSDGATTCTF